MKTFLFAISVMLAFTVTSCKDCYECDYGNGFVDECCDKTGPGGGLSDCDYFKDDCIYNGYTLRNK